MEGMKPLFLFLLLPLLTLSEENCPISDAEISKIGEVLTHMDTPIYKEEQDDVDDSSECAHLLNSIHTQLRRLTQKYKLMNKGYVKVEEFRRMAEDYDKQLEELNKELDQFKTQTRGGSENRLDELKKSIRSLEEDVDKLHQNLKNVSAEYEEVQKTLCITYLESNQISKAKDKVKQVSSRYLIEMINQFLSMRNGNVLPVIDFSSAIPDLDDRGEAYKAIYSFIGSKGRLETDDAVLLEAIMLKMNDSFVPGSKITDDRKAEIQKVLRELSGYSEKIFSKWTVDLNKSMNMVVIKNAVDHLFLTQMNVIGEKIGTRKDFNSVRNLLKLLVLSNNPYKIAAFKIFVEEKIAHALGLIWLDMESIDHAELKRDPHVSGLYNKTFESLPESLKKLSSCKNFQIYHRKDGSKTCIATNNAWREVKHPKPNVDSVLGRYKPVQPWSQYLNTACTRFRLESTNDKASVKISTEQGNALTNINAAKPGHPFYSLVGAPYTNNANMHLDFSQAWILEPNYVNDTIKIQSEFNAYQMGKSIDHLMVYNFGQGDSVVVGRYGYSGLKHRNGLNDVEFEIECVDF